MHLAGHRGGGRVFWALEDPGRPINPPTSDQVLPERKFTEAGAVCTQYWSQCPLWGWLPQNQPQNRQPHPTCEAAHGVPKLWFEVCEVCNHHGRLVLRKAEGVQNGRICAQRTRRLEGIHGRQP